MPTRTDTRGERILDHIAIQRVLAGEATLGSLHTAERRWIYRHLAAQGHSNWAISRRLGCSIATARQLEATITPRLRRTTPRELW